MVVISPVSTETGLSSSRLFTVQQSDKHAITENKETNPTACHGGGGQKLQMTTAQGPACLYTVYGRGPCKSLWLTLKLDQLTTIY